MEDRTRGKFQKQNVSIKMFNIIGIGERAGSGVPDISSVWESQGWVEPQVIEEYSPDRTILKLSFVSRESPKASKKVTEKTRMQKETILSILVRVQLGEVDG